VTRLKFFLDPCGGRGRGAPRLKLPRAPHKVNPALLQPGPHCYTSVRPKTIIIPKFYKNLKGNTNGIPQPYLTLLRLQLVITFTMMALEFRFGFLYVKVQRYAMSKGNLRNTPRSVSIPCLCTGMLCATYAHIQFQVLFQPSGESKTFPTPTPMLVHIVCPVNINIPF